MRAWQKRRVGQSNGAAQAAGQAAKDRAAQSSWPPTEDDFEAIGAAAGTAVGAAFGGPAGAAVGAVVGPIVGSLVYKFGDWIVSSGFAPGFDAGYNPLAAILVKVDGEILPSTYRVLDELAKQCGTTREEEMAAMVRWGVVVPVEEPTPQKGFAKLRAWWVSIANSGNIRGMTDTITTFQQQMFQAASARAAECETNKRLRLAGGTSSAGKALAVALVGGLAIGLLQKVIFRR